jgi:hypothetical protein
MSTGTSRTTTDRSGTGTEPRTERDGPRVDPAPAGVPRGHEPSGTETEPGRRRLTLLAWLAAAVVVIAVIPVIAVVVGATGTSEQGATGGEDVETLVEPTVGPQEYLDRLANQGYIPKEAVPDRDVLRLERQLRGGEVPPQAEVPPAEESRLLEQLANEGRIPAEAAR